MIAQTQALPRERSREATKICRAVILADDSALWNVAGLRQLDRVALTVNDLAVARGEESEVYVLWSPDFPPSQKFLPEHRRLSRIKFVTAPPESADLLLSTRVFLYRKRGLLRLQTETKKYEQLPENFVQLSSDVRTRWKRSGLADGWEYLEDSDQISTCERRFLRGGGKPQDGLVSRFINRPISQAISRLFLRTAITPSAWTLAIFVLPFVGAVCLARGDYASVVAGMVVFQLYSILDGCDGEIARAKFLESESGGRLDSLCDIASHLLLAIGLGLGLAGVFVFEGLAVAALIGLNEWWLAAAKSGGSEKIAEAIDSPFYPRHQELLEKSGMYFLGEKFVWWLMQLTKRDVAMLFFLFLALIGQSAWILHLLGASTLVMLGLATKAKRSTR